jgi:hypothetical protein
MLGDPKRAPGAKGGGNPDWTVTWILTKTDQAMSRAHVHNVSWCYMKSFMEEEFYTAVSRKIPLTPQLSLHASLTTCNLLARSINLLSLSIHLLVRG